MAVNWLTVFVQHASPNLIKMLSPRLTNCPECSSIPALLKEIDCRIAELGSNMYNNVVYMLNQPVPTEALYDLIQYKKILTSKYFNPSYLPSYTVNMIASRVKTLKYK